MMSVSLTAEYHINPVKVISPERLVSYPYLLVSVKTLHSSDSASLLSADKFSLSPSARVYVRAVVILVEYGTKALPVTEL